MEIDKNSLRTEPLPESAKQDYIRFLLNIEIDENMSKEQINRKIEKTLIETIENMEEEHRIKNKTKQSKKLLDAKFILGQFYFEFERFEEAYYLFDTIKSENYSALYQLGVILYDDLIDKENNKKNAQFDEVIDTKAAFRHPNREKWRQGFDYMLQIASLSLSEQAESVEILIHQAQYNVGKAYFQGFGVKQSDAQTEKWWLLASDDGSAKGCVNAMTALAFFYSRKNDPEYFDLSKAYFWHNEGIVLEFIKSVTKSNIFVSYLACGNGSLESQGALGTMYYFGLGCKKDREAAYECLTKSSERGNVYSMALLSDYYYKNKFYIKAADLSKKVSSLTDVKKISKETNCIGSFIIKGIALASFIQARCLEKGKGVMQDRNLAKEFYKKSCFYDPDLCQLFQNHTTYEKV